MENLPRTVKEWALNTTLHGCRHLAADHRHWIERVIWWLVQVVAFWGMVTTILDVYNEYMQTPVVTSLATSQYPAWLVPFPAVALCNINKLSKKKVQEFAEELWSKSQGNHTMDELTKSIQKLGHIYDANLARFAGIQDLSFFLQSYENNMTGLLRQLAPSCDELLVRCQWKGRNRPCIELFHRMETVHGICCVFNDGTRKGSQPETLHSIGTRLGLQVLVDPQPDDYFYPVLPTFGTQMYIYKPSDIPDSSNGMIEYIISQQREMFFTINTFSRFTTTELQALEATSRGCHNDPKETHANCLSACVFKIMLEVCRCLPYYVQNRSKAKVCDLSDIPCLSKSKDKFQHSGDEGSASCSHCLPACMDTWYDVQSSYANIILPPTKTRFSILDGLELTKNHSLINIYYQNLDTTLYKQDVLYTRTELVSNIGGICSLFNGFSFLSLIEIIYFLTIRWYTSYVDDQDSEPTIENINEQNDMNPLAPYWRELGAQHLPLGPRLKSINQDWETRQIVLGTRIEHNRKS